MSIFDRFRKGEDAGEEQSGAPAPRDLAAAFAVNIEEDKKRHPEDSAAIDRIFHTLKPKIQKGVGLPSAGQNAVANFFLSDDQLRAYACMFPPGEGGADVNVEGLISKMGYEGITSGILREEIKRCVDGKEYFHIFPIAAGTVRVDGTDGQVTECFPRRSAPVLELADDAAADFSEESFPQVVRAGAVICQIQPTVPGQDGVDVTGKVVPCRRGADVVVPMGENTRISEDGRALVAAQDGILYEKEDLFCVEPMMVIEGDLDGQEKALRVSSGLCVTGSVPAGTVVEVSGNVFIGGEVRNATVTSIRGCIRVQKGIYGTRGQEGSACVKAARQLQAQVIEYASVEAAGNVAAERIFDSLVVSGGTVNAMASEGTVIGGNIQAMRRVICRRIGDDAGTRTHIMVGCDPQVVAEWEQNVKEMADTQKMMEKLWDHISALRKTETWMTDDQKEALQQLVEQRDLYEEKKHRLKDEREALRQQMRASRSGRVRCHELCPVLEVRLGERKGEVKTHERECDIHLREDNEIILR